MNDFLLDTVRGQPVFGWVRESLRLANMYVSRDAVAIVQLSDMVYRALQEGCNLCVSADHGWVCAFSSSVPYRIGLSRWNRDETVDFPVVMICEIPQEIGNSWTSIPGGSSPGPQ